jgi:hypothetical protein
MFKRPENKQAVGSTWRLRHCCQLPLKNYRHISTDIWKFSRCYKIFIFFFYDISRIPGWETLVWGSGTNRISSAFFPLSRARISVYQRDADPTSSCRFVLSITIIIIIIVIVVVVVVIFTVACRQLEIPLGAQTVLSFTSDRQTEVCSSKIRPRRISHNSTAFKK